MANYFEMTRDELTAEKAALEEEYKKFQAMALTRWTWQWVCCR